MPQPYYVISARRITGSQFVAEPGPARFLKVPSDASDILPAHVVSGTGGVNAWSTEVQGLADGDANPLSISPAGDVLVFIHGFNNDTKSVLARHKQLAADLAAEKWHGLVISFDWPSDNQVLNYMEDRSDGAAVAGQLVQKCIDLVKRGQEMNCVTNIHLLGHSTGAYVISEAFLQSDRDGDLFKSPWRLGQVALIAGDISSSSLAENDQWSGPMFRRIMRLTNYSNPYDAVLAISNAKRLGTSPRAGRVGLPPNPNPKAVNVNCGDYFSKLDPKKSPHYGDWTHAWHIGNRVFARDLAMALEGAIDRNAIPTRRNDNGNLTLIDAPRPATMANWDIKTSAKHANRI